MAAAARASPKFPFLNLVELPMIKILDDLDIVDLFELSMLSRKAQTAVKIYCTRKTPKFELAIYTTYRIRISKMPTEPFLDAQFTSPRNTKTHDFVMNRSRNLNEKTMVFGVYDNCWYCRTNKEQENMLAFIDYFRKVFNCKLFGLTINLKNADDVQIYFKDPFFKTAFYLQVEGYAASDEEMTLFLDHPATDKILVCSPGEAYHYDRPISLDLFYINQGHWFTRDNLLNLNCKRVKMRNYSLKSDDFNAFIKNWMMSDAHKLEYLAIYGRPDEDFMNINKAMKGVDCYAGRRKRPTAATYHPHPRYPMPNYQTGMDVRRKTDGMLATVVIEKFPSGELGRFLFAAWHVFNPDFE